MLFPKTLLPLCVFTLSYSFAATVSNDQTVLEDYDSDNDEKLALSPVDSGYYSLDDGYSPRISSESDKSLTETLDLDEWYEKFLDMGCPTSVALDLPVNGRDYDNYFFSSITLWSPTHMCLESILNLMLANVEDDSKLLTKQFYIEYGVEYWNHVRYVSSKVYNQLIELSLDQGIVFREHLFPSDDGECELLTNLCDFPAWTSVNPTLTTLTLTQCAMSKDLIYGLFNRFDKFRNPIEYLDISGMVFSKPMAVAFSKALLKFPRLSYFMGVNVEMDGLSWRLVLLSLGDACPSLIHLDLSQSSNLVDPHIHLIAGYAASQKWPKLKTLTLEHLPKLTTKSFVYLFSILHKTLISSLSMAYSMSPYQREFPEIAEAVSLVIPYLKSIKPSNGLRFVNIPKNLASYSYSANGELVGKYFEVLLFRLVKEIRAIDPSLVVRVDGDRIMKKSNNVEASIGLQLARKLGAMAIEEYQEFNSKPKPLSLKTLRKTPAINSFSDLGSVPMQRH